MTLTEMKAKMYDLLVQKQAIELEMQKVNEVIAKMVKEKKSEPASQ